MGRFASGEQRAGLSSDDDVTALWKRAADRVVGFATHDDHVPAGGLLEVLEVFGNVPRQRAAFADHAVAGHRHDQRERGQGRIRAGHTATGALMRG